MGFGKWLIRKLIERIKSVTEYEPLDKFMFFLVGIPFILMLILLPIGIIFGNGNILIYVFLISWGISALIGLMIYLHGKYREEIKIVAEEL